MTAVADAVAARRATARGCPWPWRWPAGQPRRRSSASPPPSCPSSPCRCSSWWPSPGSFSRLSALPSFPTDNVLNWIVPFAILQGSAFAGFGTGFSTVRDIETGFYDRLLLAPGSRLGLLVGPVLASIVRATFTGRGGARLRPGPRRRTARGPARAAGALGGRRGRGHHGHRLGARPRVPRPRPASRAASCRSASSSPPSCPPATSPSPTRSAGPSPSPGSTRSPTSSSWPARASSATSRGATPGPGLVAIAGVGRSSSGSSLPPASQAGSPA